MAIKTKINITNGHEQSEKIKVKEKKRLWTEEKEKIDGQIERVYSEEIGKIEKPIFSVGKIFWLVLIFSLFFGFIAGTLGGFFILTSEKIKIPFLKEIDLKSYFPTREITLTTEKKITVTQDLRMAELAEKLEPQIAKIFLAKTEINEALPLLEQIYAPQEVLATGFVLTNDGWLVFSKNSLSFSSEFDFQKKYVVIVENKILPVKEIIPDPRSEIIFVKTEASNLIAAKLSNREEITFGQQVLIIDHNGKLMSNRISHPRYRQIKKNEDLIYSTDRFSDLILLEDELPSNLLGLPIFSLDK
ncbi:MAG: hypothetical protein ACPLYC_01425, partial [Minisyncoccia bacterium]